MITESKNKAKKRRPKKKAENNKLSEAERKKMLRERYGIGEKPEHFGGVH